LDAGALLHAEIVEWSRVRAGATDFGEALCRRQMAHFVPGSRACPFGCTSHADSPGEFFARCEGITVPRLLWKVGRFGADGCAPADPGEMLDELLHPPSGERMFEANLRYVGHALRLRRGAAVRDEPLSDSSDGESLCDSSDEDCPGGAGE